MDNNFLYRTMQSELDQGARKSILNYIDYLKAYLIAEIENGESNNEVFSYQGGLQTLSNLRDCIINLDEKANLEKEIN